MVVDRRGFVGALVATAARIAMQSAFAKAKGSLLRKPANNSLSRRRSSNTPNYW